MNETIIIPLHFVNFVAWKWLCKKWDLALPGLHFVLINQKNTSNRRRKLEQLHSKERWEGEALHIQTKNKKQAAIPLGLNDSSFQLRGSKRWKLQARLRSRLPWFENMDETLEGLRKVEDDTMQLLKKQRQVPVFILACIFCRSRIVFPALLFFFTHSINYFSFCSTSPQQLHYM